MSAPKCNEKECTSEAVVAEALINKSPKIIRYLCIKHAVSFDPNTTFSTIAPRSSMVEMEAA